VKMIVAKWPSTPEQKDRARETRRIWMKAWRHKNPERAKAIRLKASRRRLATPEGRAKHAAYMRKSRKEHPERERAVQVRYLAKPGIRAAKAILIRAWIDANPERKAAADKAWHAAHQEQTRASAVKHAQKCRDEMRDAYIVQLLGGRDVATPEMIEVKRLHIKIHRLIGEKR